MSKYRFTSGRNNGKKCPTRADRTPEATMIISPWTVDSLKILTRSELARVLNDSANDRCDQQAAA